jgi:hypothetical protein
VAGYHGRRRRLHEPDREPQRTHVSRPVFACLFRGASEPAISLPTWGSVVAASLPLTAEPGGGSTTATLSAGTPVLLVEEGAADPNQLLLLGTGDLDDELAIPFGWAAERSDGTEQIAREMVECPASPLTVHSV